MHETRGPVAAPDDSLRGPGALRPRGRLEGTVQVQLQAADDWQAARRNLPLRELSWLRTEGPSRVEIELDEGSILRLGPDSLVELSDYTRLSTGQRITLVSLDHGLAYLTGAAEGKGCADDRSSARRAGEHSARRALAAGSTRSLEPRRRHGWRGALPSPPRNSILRKARSVKLDPAIPARFFLNREIPLLDTDRWANERDNVLLSSTSAAHVAGLRDGLADLDAYGVWIQSGDFGAVWKPKVTAGWAPFRYGKWAWYDSLGYTWISDDPWGWLPYHYGRWMQLEGTGWVWAPGEGAVLCRARCIGSKSARLVGWGALAPGWKLETTGVPALVFEREYDLRQLYGGLARNRSGGFRRAAEGSSGDCRLRASIALAPVSGIPPGRVPAAFARGQPRAVSVSTDAAFDAPRTPPAATQRQVPVLPMRHTRTDSPPSRQWSW